jgi:hypothetical protein
MRDGISFEIVTHKLDGVQDLGPIKGRFEGNAREAREAFHEDVAQTAKDQRLGSIGVHSLSSTICGVEKSSARQTFFSGIAFKR